MCCASSSKQALIASFSYQVIRHPGREYSASMSQASMPGTSLTIRNSQVANPDSLRVNCAILGAQPPEIAFEKVHRATRPVIGPANSQSQQAHS